jgi:hypothetical protein
MRVLAEHSIEARRRTSKKTPDLRTGPATKPAFLSSCGGTAGCGVEDSEHSLLAIFRLGDLLPDPWDIISATHRNFL